MKDGPAEEALQRVVELADEAPDEEHLAALAVALMEPLVDIHWQEIQSALEGALDRSARLRDVMRGCILHVPDAVEQSLLNHAHA
jgi:hypothetical protein